MGTWQHYDFDPRQKWPWTTWERHAEGTYLVSAGATYQAGKSYGENTHTLTIDEMPAHTHEVRWNEYGRAYQENGAVVTHLYNLGTKRNQTELAGGSKPHNNMPLSIAVPLWHRIS